MPIEQLLAQYGCVIMGQAGSTPHADDAPGPSHRQTKHRDASERGTALNDRPAKRRRTSEGNALSSKDNGNQLLSAAQDSSAHASTAQLPLGSESESGDDSTDLTKLLEDADFDLPLHAKATGKVSGNIPKPEPPDASGNMDELNSGHSESEDFDSAAGSDAGEDDEQTLEEEERMAHAEGSAHPVSVHAPWLYGPCLLKPKGIMLYSRGHNALYLLCPSDIRPNSRCLVYPAWLT